MDMLVTNFVLMPDGTKVFLNAITNKPVGFVEDNKEQDKPIPITTPQTKPCGSCGGGKVI